MSDPNTPCDILVSSLTEALREAKAAAKAPLKYIHLAEGMINKVTDAALTITDEALDAMEAAINLPLGYLGDFDMAPLQNALNSMISCAAILGNPETLASLQAAKTAFDGGCHLWSQMPHLFRRTVGRLLGNAASTILNDMRNSILGKLDSMASQYKDLLKTSGIKDALRLMDGLVSCAASSCATMSPLIDQMNSLHTSLGMGENYEPLDIIQNSSNISAAKKYSMAAAQAKLSTLRTSIENFKNIV